MSSYFWRVLNWSTVFNYMLVHKCIGRDMGHKLLGPSQAGGANLELKTGNSLHLNKAKCGRQPSYSKLAFTITVTEYLTFWEWWTFNSLDHGHPRKLWSDRSFSCWAQLLERFHRVTTHIHTALLSNVNSKGKIWIQLRHDFCQGPIRCIVQTAKVAVNIWEKNENTFKEKV